MDKMLDTIKKIPMDELADTFGYAFDKSSSSAAWNVWKKDGAELVCKKATNTFFQRKSDVAGSPVDLIQDELKGNLGDVRRWFKTNYSAERAATVRREYKPEQATQIDRQTVKTTLSSLSDLKPDNGYLIGRSINRETLSDKRFSKAIKQTSAGFPVFPMRDREGFSGYEIKALEGSIMTAGEGGRSLWTSTGVANAPRIYLAESVIDAMSHAQHKNDKDSGYVSCQGQLNDKQLDLLTSVLQRAHERGADIISIFDNDKMGQKFTEMVEAKAQPGQKIGRERPVGKDWNNDLRVKKLYIESCASSAGRDLESE